MNHIVMGILGFSLVAQAQTTLGYDPLDWEEGSAEVVTESVVIPHFDRIRKNHDEIELKGQGHRFRFFSKKGRPWVEVSKGRASIQRRVNARMRNVLNQCFEEPLSRRSKGKKGPLYRMSWTRKEGSRLQKQRYSVRWQKNGKCYGKLDFLKQRIQVKSQQFGKR
ncbi:MAG: hypothetical protein CL678_08050 [Bdellovibrionaceae bacterium]|nr:hypothetical protein [Pseudobdellovibrionaceae bacterium]|tara:strand:- start:5215 stop:5709 length:495 start_codon:yes stop_codon:yes gene_type:complete